MPLMGLAPLMSRTVIRFTREGLEGKVTGYKEVTIPAHSITAKNSTSLLRKPATKAEMVRGKAGFFPFAPGGLDAAYSTSEEIEKEELKLEDRIDADGLLSVAPGFRKGLRFKAEAVQEEEEDVPDDFKFGDIQPLRKKQEKETSKKPEDGPLSELDSIDDLLPVEVCYQLPQALSNHY